MGPDPVVNRRQYSVDLPEGSFGCEEDDLNGRTLG
jgi:hypothetical protein